MTIKSKGLLLILLTALLWGPNFLFIKVAVSVIPPVTVVLLRVGFGAAILFLVSLMQKIDLWRWRIYWKNFAVMALFMNVIPFTLIGLGEVYISSALTGILNSLAVISTAVLAHYFGPHDPLTRNRILGIFSGIVGLVVIYLPMLLQQEVGNIWGSLLIIGACISYGVGGVYVRTHLQKIPPMAAVTGQMVIATAMMLLLSLSIDRPWNLTWPDAHVAGSVVLLGCIGTGVSFIFYYKAIHLAGATFANCAVFLLAIFSMTLGALVLHEPITWNLYLGAFFILAGLLGVSPALVRK